MNFDHFVGQVQHRARLGTMGAAVGAVRATLETLAERLDAGEAKDLAAQLPEEIAYYVTNGSALSGGGERFSVNEFFKRIASRERIDLPIAVYHARVVFEVMREAVSEGEIRDVLNELPADFQKVVLSGSAGRLKFTHPTAKALAHEARVAVGRRTTAEEKKRTQPLPRIHPESPRESKAQVRVIAKPRRAKPKGEKQYSRVE